jgi:signal transduction histidine kinase
MSAIQPDEKKLRPERDQTDASLRAERENSDQVIAESLDATAEDADELVDRARKNADAVLVVARKRADAKQGRGLDLVRERALEDDAVRTERAIADAAIRREREEQARVLAALLPLEREKTDRYLLSERVDSDETLARRDDFLGIVAHDLRNLLSGIVLNAGVLTANSREHDGGDRVAAGMQRIQRYAARMNRLIGDLVDIVSIDAGKLAMHYEQLDATTLVVEAVEAFTPGATEKGLTIVADINERPLLSSFDHDRMMQVLANLVTNAIKFTDRGGSILIRGERVDDELHLWVCDTGCGIERALLEAVFGRFWQMGENDRRGLGLGLYISKCIVEAHRGRIWAESVLGEGSEFHVSIPASQATPSA